MNKVNPLIFGAELARQRKMRGLMQAELGTLIGIKAQYISILEVGKREAGLSTIVALARALGIHPGLLLNGYAVEREHAAVSTVCDDFPVVSSVFRTFLS